MNQIADEAGVTKPVLYQHFESKRDLFVEVLSDIGERLDAAVFNQTTKTGSPFEQVQAGFSGYLDFIESDPEGFTIIASAATRQDNEFSVQGRHFEAKMAQTVASLINIDGLDEDGRLANAYGIVGLVKGMVLYWSGVGTGKMSRDDLLKQLTDLAWMGLRR